MLMCIRGCVNVQPYLYAFYYISHGLKFTNLPLLRLFFSVLQLWSPGCLGLWQDNAAQLHRWTAASQFGRDLGAWRTAGVAWFRCAWTANWLHATGE